MTRRDQFGCRALRSASLHAQVFLLSLSKATKTVAVIPSPSFVCSVYCGHSAESREPTGRRQGRLGCVLGTFDGRVLGCTGEWHAPSCRTSGQDGLAGRRCVSRACPCSTGCSERAAAQNEGTVGGVVADACRCLVAAAVPASSAEARQQQPTTVMRDAWKLCEARAVSDARIPQKGGAFT